MKEPAPADAGRRAPLRALLRSWFNLTATEQTALLVVLALFLLGLLMTWRHAAQGLSDIVPRVPPQAKAQSGLDRAP